TLNILNMGYNTIGSEGAAHIVEMLKTKETITTLNISENDLGDLGAEHISTALQCNKVSTVLNFVSIVIEYV
ncbi:unnamed protein product, partial [Rotaria magnacalcarata]